MELKDIDFLLSHFGGTLFPRKMMTYARSYQFTTNSIEDIWQKCKEAGFKDCRINAYPEYTGFKEVVRYPPDFIFIDLDLQNFSRYKDPRKMLDKTLQNTLDKILSSFRSKYTNHLTEQYNEQTVKPTVLWTGNGYHIYLPIQAIVLDQTNVFSQDQFPSLFAFYNGKYYGSSVSEVFLKYMENLFTDEKADPQHKPKYKTCLIRFPNTYNSKCLGRGLNHEESRVMIIQEWDGYRPPIQFLLKDFRRWITQEEINYKILVKKKQYPKRMQSNELAANRFQINWIEKLLLRGIADGRKEVLRLILGPYLAKRKSYDEASIELQNWLDKCDKVRPLDRDFKPRQKINTALKNTKGFMKLENLKIKYRWLYDVIGINPVN